MAKLLHVITGLGYGGAESMLLRLLSELRDNYELKVVALNDNNPRVKDVKALGVPVETLGLSPDFPNPLKLFRLLKIMREFAPDLVQTWMYHADLLGGLATRIVTDAPLVWSLRQSDVDPERTSLKTRLVINLCARLSGSLPTRIISCSEAGKDVHVGKGYPEDKIEVIPNAYDVEKFKPDEGKRADVRGELGLDPEEFLIGFVARFHPQKDHETFVEAARILATQESQVKFLLCGPGVDWSNERLNSWVEAAGLTDRFYLLGQRRDVPAINCALDLATMTSAFAEGFPNVVAEAMACETPCVVTDVGDAALMVGEAGEVVPGRRPEELARAWGEFVQMSPAKRTERGRRSRQRIVANYSPETVVPMYQKIYGEVLEKK